MTPEQVKQQAPLQKGSGSGIQLNGKLGTLAYERIAAVDWHDGTICIRRAKSQLRIGVQVILVEQGVVAWSPVVDPPAHSGENQQLL